MKVFGYFVLLVAAFLAVTAIPGPHDDELVACDNEGECLTYLHERAIMGSSTQVQAMTGPSSFAETTVTVDTYTTVPCSNETDITESTTTTSKHTTSTELLTVTVTSSSSITSSVATSSASSLIYASISSTAASSTITSTSSPVTSTSVDTLSTDITLSTGTTFSTVSSSSTSSLIIVPFLSTSVTSEIVSSSTSSVGGVDSTAASTNMAYISPSYGPGPSTALPAYSGIVSFSTTSSIDAISATIISASPVAVTVVTQPVIPIPASTSAGFTTLTTCSTSTYTTTINVGYNPSYVPPSYAGALSSVLASMSLISEQYYSTASEAATTTTASLTSPSTGEEACSALSTVWVTVTGTAAPTEVSSAAASVPANPLDSQPETSSNVGNNPSTLASTDAISATDSASAPLTSATSVLSTATESASASNSNSAAKSFNTTTILSGVTHTPSTSTAATSSTEVAGTGGDTNSMAPAIREKNHVNMALVMCVVGAMLMFAI